MSQIAIIDVGAGNLYSVEKAARHVMAADDQLTIVRAANDVVDADKIILPGVGAFASCMQGLLAIDGLREALIQKVLLDKTPLLGICVGMQILFEAGHEHEICEGLGWIKGEVVPLTPDDASLKIPHMGWNELIVKTPHPLLSGIEPQAHAYFVHSFHCKPQEDIAIATVDYGGEIVAAIAQENIVATQFHPEKSQKTGLRILQNFLQMPHAA